MIHKIRGLSISKLNLKNIALASAITMAATSMTGCSASTSKNEIERLQKDSIELTTQINSLEQDIMALNIKKHNENNATIHFDNTYNNIKHNMDSIKQSKKAKLEYVTEKLKEAKKNFKNDDLPLGAKLHILFFCCICGIAGVLLIAPEDN